MEESDSLYAEGVRLYEMGRYKEAMPFFERSDSIDNTLYPEESTRANYSRQWLASCMYKSGDSIRAAELSGKYRLDPIDRRLTVESDSLSEVANKLFQAGEFEESLKYLNHVKSLEANYPGKDSYYYLNTLAFIGQVYQQLGKVSEYFEVFEEILPKYLEIYGPERYYQDILHQISSSYREAGAYDKAIEKAEECESISRNGDKGYPSGSTEYGLILENLAECYASSGNYKKAAETIDKAIKLAETFTGDDVFFKVSWKINQASYYEKFDLDKAIEVSQKMLEEIEEIRGKDIIYADGLYFLSVWQSQAKNYESAIHSLREALKIIETIEGKDSKHYLERLNYLSLAYYNNSDHKAAIEIQGPLVERYKELYGENDPNMAIYLSNLALYHYASGNVPDAIKYGTKASEIYAETQGKKTNDYINYLQKIAAYYGFNTNLNKAIALLMEAIDIYDEINEKHNSDYYRLINDLASFYRYGQNYTDAEKILNAGIDEIKNLGGEYSTDYFTLSNSLALVYVYTRRAEKALEIFNNILENFDSNPDFSREDFSILQKNIGLCHYYKFEFDKALEYYLNALEILEKEGLRNSEAYADQLRNLSTYYSNLGDREGAQRCLREALEIYEHHLGVEQINYSNTLNSLSAELCNDGKYVEAIEYALRALRDYREIWGNDNFGEVLILNRLAIIYGNFLGNYKTGLSYAEMAEEIIKNTIGADYSTYYSIINNKAICHAGLEQYDLAIEEEEKAYEGLANKLWEKSIDCQIVLNNLGNFCAKAGDFEKALDYMKRAYDLSVYLQGYESASTELALSNLAGIHSINNDYENALKYGLEAFSVAKKIYPPEHPQYIRILRLLSKYFYKLGRNDEMQAYAIASQKLLAGYVRSNFAGLTSRERADFWENESEWFQRMTSYALASPTSDMIETAFNSMLLSKGILLDSEREFSNLIKESEDKDTQKLYQELTGVRKEMEKIRALPPDQRTVNLDSLGNRLNLLERRLISRSKVIGDYTKNMAIEWQDVKNKLGPKDVAIEFTTITDENDSTIYAAFILNPNMASPKLKVLFGSQDLKRVRKHEYYETDKISRLVWLPLDNFIKEAENIYFVPEGELYNIAIESLPHYGQTGLISDNHNFYRLSSTRELAIERAPTTLKDITLFGGLNYDMDTEELEADMEKYPDLMTRSYSYFSESDSLNLRKGARYLPGTKTEVENISNSLRKRDINPIVFTGNEGTEASFKNLSGSGTRNLHLATHGFYWTEKQAGRSKLDFVRSLDGDENILSEDKALTRCGLLLSGANNALQGQSVPANVEDGILTAKEIASLDFRGVDLVVMSACQTGLGEISGDGVFGLQRGFKKAGAKTMMMSLWEVDDRATQKLMERFYDNMTSGADSYSSLREAQKYLREYEEPGATGVQYPFKHPRYWAAFILLDAI